jgi:DNA processing protein
MTVALDFLSLALVPGIGPRTLRDLLGRAALADIPIDAEARRRAEQQMKMAERAGARIVSWDDEDYPQLLKRTYDPPPVMWVRGTLRAEESAVAVVGSRGASAVGRLAARSMGRDLAAAGLTVVSGLARGIDTAAHEGAVETRGRTVAVLGSGLDRLYPRENAPLVERIVEAGGAVVTEFPMGTPPEPGHFPRRNRVIAGWSKAVVVVEAQTKSGALGTARTAAEEGRDVYAVPGHPSQPNAAGTNQLIREGAALVRDAADVLSELGLSPALVSPLPVPEGDSLWTALRADTPSSLEELHVRSGRAIPDLLGELTALELAARVKRLPGGLYVRN